MRKIVGLFAIALISFSSRADASPTKLYRAVEAGDIEAVQVLLKDESVDVNEPCKCHFGLEDDPLTLAVRNADWAIVEVLLDHPKIIPNGPSDMNIPLVRAVELFEYSESGELKESDKNSRASLIVHALLNHPRIDVNGHRQGYYPYSSAIRHAPIEVVEKLVENPNLKIDYNEVISSLGFPSRDYRVIRWFLADKNAPITAEVLANIYYRAIFSPRGHKRNSNNLFLEVLANDIRFDVYAKHGHGDHDESVIEGVARCLGEGHSNCDWSDDRGEPFYRLFNHRTFKIHEASMANRNILNEFVSIGDYEKFKKMLDGARWTGKILSANYPTLLTAVEYGQEKVVRDLLEFSDLEVPKDALFMALKKKYAAVAKLLLSDERVDIKKLDPYGDSVLTYAFFMGEEGKEILPILLSHTDLNNVLNSQGLHYQTTLHYAVEHNRIDIIKALVKLDQLNPNLPNAYYPAFRNTLRSWTPLQIAIYKYNAEAVALLVAHKNLDINFRNNRDGNTALHMATYRSDLLFDLMLSHPKVDVCLTNANGERPIDLLSSSVDKKRYERLKKLMEDQGCRP